MRKRFNLLPTYHFEENTDGQIRGAAERVLRDCTIYGNCGKNLLPYPFKYTTKTINGITFTDNGDGTVTANGTATATAQFFPKESSDGPLLAPGTYTFSGCPKGGDWKIYNIRLTGFTADRDFGNGSTFTLTQATRVGMSLTITSGVTVENLVFKPQIESGSTKTDYEPYKEVGDLDAESGKYILPVTVSGKNLLPYPYTDTTHYQNGVTWTDNGDGTITASGTATDYTAFAIVRKKQGVIQPNKEYVFSSNGTDDKNIVVDIILYDKDGNHARNVNANSSFTTAENEELITIILKRSVSGYSVGGTFKPQLELGSTATEPKTTNLLLDAPLGPGESISCREKGLLVPELAIIDPNITNYVIFGSEVKPSSAKFDYYKY